LEFLFSGKPHENFCKTGKTYCPQKCLRLRQPEYLSRRRSVFSDYKNQRAKIFASSVAD